MEALMAALAGGGDARPDLPLDAPALDLASIEFPELRPRPYIERLDDMGVELAAATTSMSGPDFLARTNIFLFQDIGFHGNERNYYDPRNSCLNWVLDQRTGIPITLSVVYIEICRRIGRPVHGVGLPGHFVIQYDDGEFSTYLDPFNGGKLMSEEECRELARSVAGPEEAADPRLLRPVTPHYILIRMLNNLRAAYFRGERFDRADVVLDLLVRASPRNAEYYKGRAISRVHLRRFSAAAADFDQYLRLNPEADDRDEIVRQLSAIHRLLGALN